MSFVLGSKPILVDMFHDFHDFSPNDWEIGGLDLKEATSTSAGAGSKPDGSATNFSRAWTTFLGNPNDKSSHLDGQRPQ